MRRTCLWLIFGLTAIAPGCSFARNAYENIKFQPLYACTDRTSHHRHLQMGREAWRQMVLAFPGHSFSCAYREGFVEGFADYLDNGGTGEPPVVAPPKYRLNESFTPAGYADQKDWFAGFRHGSATGKASGLRSLVVLPVHWPPNFSGYGDPVNPGGGATIGTPSPEGGGGQLPAPTRVDEPMPPAQP